jgi:RNA polymerase sigma factor (sigma-70 family)
MHTIPIDPRRVEQLYGELQPQLARILAANLHAPGWLVDDACQMAWGQLLVRGDRVPAGAELGWLSTAATRIALRLLRQERARAARRVDGEPWAIGQVADDPEGKLELGEVLSAVRRLPERQARLVVMCGLGYGYAEMATATGQSSRTVKRQLSRARARLRLAVAG